MVNLIAKKERWARIIFQGGHQIFLIQGFQRCIQIADKHGFAPSAKGKF